MQRLDGIDGPLRFANGPLSIGPILSLPASPKRAKERDARDQLTSMNTLESAFVSERRCLHHINVEVCRRSFLVAIRRLRERAL